MHELDYSRLDLIRQQLKLCETELAIVCEGWESVGIDDDTGSHFYTDERLAEIVDNSLINYHTSKITEYVENLVEYCSGDQLKNEVLKNLTLFTRDRQETFYLAQLMDFLTEVHRLIDRMNLYTLGSNVFYKRGNATKYGQLHNLTLIDIDRLEYAIICIENGLQPFRTADDFKIYLNGRTMTDQIMPNDRPDKNQPSIDLVPKPAEPGVKLQWKGDKTDLAELVWALAKSGRITDTTTGQPATQKEIARQMVTLLGLDSLDVTGLVKGRMNTYKATSDGKTFVAALYQLVNERAESA